MIDKIIAFSIKQKLVIGFLVFLLVVAGIYSAFILPVDAVPDITNNQVQIITSSPTLSASEVERFITYPIEVVMKSLPDIVELRSISKFGISVVTVVFDDNVDIYFARNLVFQKLKETEENIPEGLGKPKMAPVSTGLGEIYQYIVRPEKPNDTSFSSTELRTIQDWIVKRQLHGTEGVAEINSLGGYEKQYHVHVNPDALTNYNLALRDVYEAVTNNNSNVGGGYIEKRSDQYSIRGIGLIEKMEDLENIVVKTEHGTPVYLKQIANVELGQALRVGAATQDGNGEVVSGMVMMLKGANSREVAKRVHERIQEIKNTLPQGVTIDEFYNRENLVEKIIKTVIANLVEGGLIVIVVLVLLLGNLRAGFIVASVIPLSMLFAMVMMNLFKVSGNLMSLGAIDFGLIVDGAVIIVEAAVVAIAAKTNLNGKAIEKTEMDETVFSASAGIMKSAVFGILIILIVYLPIFALGGIEGKMFKPMAFTVGFALLGALFLSLTYVPMMSSLILKPKAQNKENFSERIINAIRKIYLPSLEFALRKKAMVISSAVVILTMSIFAFTKLGGEFIPKLDEGDIAIQLLRLPGISLTESNNISSKVESILKSKFPEVITVVSKTGASEIATDPMGVEFSDVFVILKPKDEWVSGKTKDELIEKMEKELSVIPGIAKSFSQPIELRFNELLAGARGDIAVKIFGDDLEILSEKGKVAASIMGSVKGAQDVSVQRVEGLPQMQIMIRRDRIAKYGINVEDVNEVIETALAGKSAGVIFEGDRKFDIVVRYPDEYKRDINSVKNILVSSSSGLRIPLSEVADIEVKEGYAEITRDNAKRRIVIQANVRGRDMESFVNELREKIKNQLPLPPGYLIEYGGQFKNLESARQRLMIAVPVSLFLIFALLFAAFNSLKQGLLVFTGIPFAIIGGIFSLLIRGMPLSISAGVGFIALFGVAVLNGIVMIAYFNRLEEKGVKNAHDRIIQGTRARLRPILMTAAVASLGFIPMAISTSAGAEVQRPLATVVIGGLISSTLLTLIVLPVLYGIFYKHENPKYSFSKIPLVLLFLLIPLSVTSQTKLGLEDAVKTAIENNPQIKSAKFNVEREQAVKLKSVNIPRPEFFVEYEGIKGSINNFENRKIGILQDLEFPSSYFLRSDVQSSQVLVARAELSKIINELKADVKQTYVSLLLQHKLLEIANDNLKIYNDFLVAAEKKYDAGATSNLEVLGAKVNKIKFENEIRNIQSQIRILQSDLKRLMGVEYEVTPADDLNYQEIKVSKDELLEKAFLYNPEIQIAKFQKEKFLNKMSLSRAELLPNLSLKYYSQNFGSESGYWGFELGLGIPLWFWWEPAGNIKEAGYEYAIASSDEIGITKSIQSDLNKTYEDYENSLRQIRFFEEEALKETDEILRQSKISYEEGAISYVEYLQALALSYDIKTQFATAIYNYNNSIIRLEKIISGEMK
jgi:cobalt-zinc-cadmium resistance protein CzcA